MKIRVRKLPVELDAEQMDLEHGVIPEGVYRSNECGSCANPQIWGTDCYCEYYVNTMEGTLKVKDHYWIITGVKGERWPIRNDIFEKTYECL